MLSATDGKLSYGPGTTYDTYEPEQGEDAAAAALDHQPLYYLTGHVLLSFPRCGDDCGDGASSDGTFLGYGTGSWPPG